MNSSKTQSEATRTLDNSAKGRKGSGAVRKPQVALLATDGVEQDELTSPRNALLKAGAEVFVVSPLPEKIQMWKHHSPSDTIPVDMTLDESKSFKFDALVLPGGVMNPDDLRMNPLAVSFVRQFVEQNLPIAAICHGPWLLIEADAVNGIEITSWPSLKTDLTNAGATWVDRPVVRDGQIITSRKPDDLPAFNREILSLVMDGARNEKPAKGSEQGPKVGAEAVP